jgi:2-polyprenyl-3-methyl-5-hydroxy-6-metoxy-1,4-benzoquinol methylase
MNQIPSTTTSEWKKMEDFGTYHHSTHRGSEKIREKVNILFTVVFGDLPFARDDKLKILDVGCGLGLLSCLCAEYYPKAKITGIDTFEHASLKGSSLTKAKNNAKILEFSERIRFQKRGCLFVGLRQREIQPFCLQSRLPQLRKEAF